MSTDEEKKAVVKEALKEWMDEKFLAFGKWSFATFAFLVFTALVYFVLKMNGWQIVQTPLSSHP